MFHRKVLKDITDLPPHAALCTFYVSSLYINIPHEEVFKTIQEALAIHGSLQPWHTTVS